MKIIAPSYYLAFKCIADKCKHSCCIGWEIDIDEDTYEYYKTIKGDFGKRLSDNIVIEEDTPHFLLDKEERCPFLNKNGLCDIITTIGEESLCQICDDHPRYRNFYSDRTEIGLGFCCEAAAELILSCKEKVRLITIDDDNQIEEIWQDEEEFLSFRQDIFDILQDRQLEIEKRVDKMLLTCGAKMPNKPFRELVDIFLGLERLDEKWTDILLLIKNYEYNSKEIYPYNWDVVFEQILVYFVYRHFTDSLDDGRLKERAIYVAVSYYIIKQIFIIYSQNKSVEIEDMVDIVRMYSSETEYSTLNMDKLFDVFSEK